MMHAEEEDPNISFVVVNNVILKFKFSVYPNYIKFSGAHAVIQYFERVSVPTLSHKKNGSGGMAPALYVLHFKQKYSKRVSDFNFV